MPDIKGDTDTTHFDPEDASDDSDEESEEAELKEIRAFKRAAQEAYDRPDGKVRSRGSGQLRYA